MRGWLPWAGAGLALLRDPTAFLTRCRERLGDTFLLDAFGYRILWVFSPDGVRNLWALPEREASKGLADFALLRHKVPDDLFAGRRTRPHDLFARDDVERYLANLREAVDVEIGALGESGELELFAFTRRLGHRVGLASWGGRAAARPGNLERLAPLFDRLDSSESFVHPHRGFWTVATGKRAERAALAGIESIYGELLAEHEPGDALFDDIRERWADASGEERVRGIARDVVLVHMGSMSNLFAAMAWTVIDLLDRKDLLERVRDGDDALLALCAQESIRMAQRSIVLRQVLREVTLADERAEYRVAPGAFLATMMSVTNRSAAPGLETFDPHRFEGIRLRDRKALPTPELVTTFGHGAHTCPATRFSISAIQHAVGALVRTFDLEPRYRAPRPLRRQIGGVARADRPCTVRYRRAR